MEEHLLKTENKKYNNSLFRIESNSKIIEPISKKQNEKFIKHLLDNLDKVVNPFLEDNSQNLSDTEEKIKNCKNSFDYRFFSKIPKPYKHSKPIYEKYPNFQSKIPSKVDYSNNN